MSKQPKPRLFGPCAIGDHYRCPKSYERFHIDPKTNKVIYSGETIQCGCTKRSCPCYKERQ